MVVRLFHRPKLQILSTRPNIIVKVVRYLYKSEAAVHKKTLIHEYLFTKVAGLHNKEKKSIRDLFLGVVPNVSENVFCKT